MNATALVVDSNTRRFWVLVDKSNGTMFCQSVSSGYDYDKATNYSHDQIDIFTSERVAKRAAADAFLNDGVDVEPIEVTILRKK